MNKRLSIIFGIIILSLISSLFDVIFFSNYLYQGINGKFMLFFIRSLIELMLFGLGIMVGLGINLHEIKK